MRKCQEALTVPLSEYDDRMKLGTGYLESLSRTQKEISAVLKLVLELDEITAQSVQIICEKAAKLWVAAGGQRCRLMVIMQGLKSTTESKESSGQDQSVEFVIRPELRRIGDTHGELFDDLTTISGCEGEVVRMVYGS
jgi:hypothetical protein